MNGNTLSSTILAFENAISEERHFPASIEDFLGIIRYYQQEDFHPQALEAVEEAIQQYPAYTGFYLLKAHLLIELHRETQAMHVLTAARQLDSSAPEITLLRAEALSCMEQYEEALVLLEALKAEVEGAVCVDVWVAEALVYEHMQEYERMFFALKAALQEAPRHETALERMSVCIDMTRRYEESVALHEALLNADPFSHLAWYNLGHAQACLGQYEEAIQAYEYAFLTNEMFEPAYLDCAELCLESGRPEKALQCCLEALERFEPYAELYFQTGCCYKAMGDYAHALNCFTKALGQDPFDNEVLFQIGLCHAATKKWNKAIQAFQKSLDLDELREDCHIALANAFAQTGQPQKATAHYATALELAPENSLCILPCARFLLDNGQYQEALTLMEDAVNWQDEEDPRLLYAHIACLFAAGKHAEANYRLGDALEEYPEEAALLREWAPELEQVASETLAANREL